MKMKNKLKSFERKLLTCSKSQRRKWMARIHRERNITAKWPTVIFVRSVGFIHDAFDWGQERWAKFSVRVVDNPCAELVEARRVGRRAVIFGGMIPERGNL